MPDVSVRARRPLGASITIDGVRRARSTIGEQINWPPFFSPHLPDQIGLQIHLKMENLQRAGAYEVRGAMNAVRSLDEARKAAGVIAVSAGNCEGADLCGQAQRNPDNDRHSNDAARDVDTSRRLPVQENQRWET